MHVASLHARNPGELFCALGAWGARAPGRLDQRGRQKELDRWVLNKILLARNGAGTVAFPVTVRDSEAPDFNIREGETRYGLEVVEAVDHDEQAWRTKQAREHDGRGYSIPRKFTNGNRSRGLVHDRIRMKSEKGYPDGTHLAIYLRSYDPMLLSAGELLDRVLPLPSCAERFPEIWLVRPSILLELKSRQIIA